ncbi:MAG: SpaA isopeptide-forming pilin-related protein [Cytophagales bacterium]|nr:SpaA isopeptide-forming pilin-related protein [Cytophagales bacterium]
MNKYIIIIAVAALSLASFSPAQQVFLNLKVTVMNNLGKAEEGVRLRIYKTEEDFKSEKNVVQEHYTDTKGKFSFKDLEPRIYYISATKAEMDNYDGAVKTDTLKINAVNKITIIIQ